MPKKDDNKMGATVDTGAKKVKKSAEKKSGTHKTAQKHVVSGMSAVIGEEHQKAKKLKISKHDMKKDELVEASGKIVDYLTGHGNQVLVIAGIVIIVALLTILVNFYSSSKKAKSSALFTQARNLYDLALNETPPSIATLSGSLETFDTLLSNYGDGVEGALGNFYKGNIYFNLQDYDKALDSYSKYLSFKMKNKAYDAIAMTNIAYCYENKNDYEKAIEQFKKITESASGFIKESAFIDLGLAYEKVNKIDEASKLYADFVANYPSSSLVETAQARINSIQAK